MNEIKNSVAAAIHSRDQVRPRHRTLRRDARGQTPERSLRCQAGEVWHLAIRHELGEQVRIEPIDAEDDDFSGPNRSPLRVLAGNEQA